MSKDLNYSLNLDSFKVLGNDELQKLKGGRCEESCKKACTPGCQVSSQAPGPAGSPLEIGQ